MNESMLLNLRGIGGFVFVARRPPRREIKLGQKSDHGGGEREHEKEGDRNLELPLCRPRVISVDKPGIRTLAEFAGSRHRG